jgi:hypothetical protein
MESTIQEFKAALEARILKQKGKQAPRKANTSSKKRKSPAFLRQAKKGFLRMREEVDQEGLSL